MTYATIAPATAPTASVAESKAVFETTLSAALEHARRLTAMYDINNAEVVSAWEAVEELNVALAHKQAPVQTAFARYCDANPDAPEARIYDV